VRHCVGVPPGVGIRGLQAGEADGGLCFNAFVSASSPILIVNKHVCTVIRLISWYFFLCGKCWHAKRHGMGLPRTRAELDSRLTGCRMVTSGMGDRYPGLKVF
jgi:hypothetical protein